MYNKLHTVKVHNLVSFDMYIHVSMKQPHS